MPNFIVRSSGTNTAFAVRLADCSAEHAQSVVDQLNLEPVAPDDLFYEEVERLYDDAPATATRPWYRRFF